MMTKENRENVAKLAREVKALSAMSNGNCLLEIYATIDKKSNEGCEVAYISCNLDEDLIKISFDDDDSIVENADVVVEFDSINTIDDNYLYEELAYTLLKKLSASSMKLAELTESLLD